MAVCALCDRSFGSKKALDQHRRDSPMHTDTFCKACNRTFGTNSALKQHEHDSPVHQRQSLENATTVIPTSVFDSSPLPYDARADELCEDSIQRTSQTPLSSNSDSVSNHNRHGPTLENTLRAFSISVQEPIIKPPQVLSVNTLKRKPKRKEETRTSFRFPELHERIEEAVSPEVSTAWYQNNDRKGYNSEYVTCVVGSFSCNNQTCKKRSWGSGVVSILIRGYARNGYSAVVFNQRCKLCENLGTFTMDETTYVERVAYRIKKWAGVWVQQPVYNNHSKGPHAESLCEGCKGGACPYSIVQS